MRFSYLQIIVLCSALGLFVLILSLGRTKPLTKKGGEDSTQTTDTLPPLNDEAMLAGAYEKLDSNQLSYLTQLEQEKSKATLFEDEVLALKLISRTWNEFGNYAAGGYYAQKVAELAPSGEAWAIAGTTFGIAFNREQNDVQFKKYVGHKAVACFQKAAELEPDTVAHRINEAIMYVDLSIVDASVMPMTGAQKLLALDKEFPNNVNVNLQMGRLSLNMSGDIQKAIPRFERIIAIADSAKVDAGTLVEAHFSLTECYKQLNQKEKVLFHFDKAIALSKDKPTIAVKLQEAKDLFEKEGK